MTDILTVRTDIFNAFDNIIRVNADTKITKTANVHPSFNDRQLIREGYPQIIIHEPLITTQKLTIGSSGSSATDIYRLPISVTIEVRDNSAANARTVADEVQKGIINGKERLRETYNIYDVNFSSDDVQVVEFTQRKSTHIYRINVSCLFMDTA